MSKRQPLHAAQIPPSFGREEPHLIGVSGGRDSVALLHWLKSQGFERLVVCHFDHQLREGSAEDAAFTEKLAAQLGLECVCGAAPVRELARRAKRSIETAARDARYAFFARVASERECARVFLAHHADDQVETFLMQLVRGAGSAGLGGMAVADTREIGGVTLHLARPLLAVWRSEIDAYIVRHALDFREDPTNATLEPTRNRARHLAIPALREAFGRDPRAALWRAAELLREEDALLSSSPELRDLPAMLDVVWLRGLAVAMQRRVLRAWLCQRGVEGAGFDEVEAARGLLAGKLAKVNLPAGLCARRRAGYLFVDRQQRA